MATDSSTIRIGRASLLASRIRRLVAGYEPDDARYGTYAGGPIGEAIARGRRIMTASRLVVGALVWATISLGVWLPLFWLDNAFHLPPGLRLALSVGALVLMVSMLWRNVVEPLLRPQSLAHAALVLEQAFEVPENLLINALCFEGRQFRSAEKPFAVETVKVAMSHVSGADMGELWNKRKIARRTIPVAVLLLLWLLYMLAFGRHAANAFARYVRPTADTPPAGAVVLEVTPDHDITVSEGDDLTVTVRVKGQADTLRSYPQIVWKEDARQIDPEQRGGETGTMKAIVGQANEFSHTFERVGRPFAFRVFAADTYSPSVAVAVNRVPRIAESQFCVTPPAYTGLQPIDSMGPPEPLSGLPGSAVVVKVRLDKKAQRLRWRTADETVEFEEADGQWQARTQLQKPGTYEIDVRTPGVAKDVTIASGTILLSQDGPPRVEFDADDSRLLVDPGQRLQLRIQASDDFGLRDLQATLRQGQTTGEPAVLQRWAYEGPPGTKGPVTETLLLTIDSERFQPGNSYILEAAARDFSPQENVGRSRPLTIQVRGLDELAVSPDDPAADAFAALDKAIQAQQTALGATRNLEANLQDVVMPSRKASENAEALSRHRDELGKKQSQVGACMTEAWEVSSEPRPEFVRKLVSLRDGEHKQAMEKLQGVAIPESARDQSAAADMVGRSLDSVERLQAYILEQRIALKGGVARQDRITSEKNAELTLGEAEDLKPDPEEALEIFKNELKAFAGEQKKIMHDRQMIADLPPEDFTSEQEARLEELALDQSKLAAILEDAVNDFTNLDLQDFGDDAMVEAVKSVYEKAQELAETAAEAAEMRQARVDAYRLETEAVEMAEELMINCEATMGFRDNIQFIAEIPEDEQLVAPLAELPWELEDLVGDLITSEQEMRPEVEDIGSYLNSLDHTAGPIADGTISSTSAKGKTGDQRPEDNIIQGRSGAGRSGMSDGQLVEPVAKSLSDNEYALRERLSNTPLESGEVRDEDTKAQTGGTGLGKITDGSSMFGVGGELPPKVLDMMKTTQERQLEIQRSTREIVAKLEQHNLPTAELEQSVAAMQALEEALQNRDGMGIQQAYASTLDSLNRSRGAIGRQVVVQQTRDAALARRLQEMQSQGRGPQFKGYEHIISAYFEALARQDGNSNGGTR